MSSLYERLQGTATRLMDRFQQGVVTYNAPGADTGTPWNPAEGEGASYALTATVKGAGANYRDSTLVRESDLIVTASVFSVNPTLAGTVTIDGREHQIVMIEQIPAAGTIVAWRMAVRA